MLFNLIAASLLLLVLFNVCFFLWAWYSSRERPGAGGTGNGGTTGDGTGAGSARGDASPFLVKPFVQLGTASGGAPLESLEILWHAVDEPAAEWTVGLEFTKKSRGLMFMHQVLKPEVRQVRIPGGGEDAPAHKQFRVVVKNLRPNEHFYYRVLRDGKPVFDACAVAKKSFAQPYRFVAVGDIGDGRPGQAKVAYQIWKQEPDFVVVPGDIAYKRGRVSEYLQKFFPVMNHDKASPSTGAPLLRHTPFVTCGGNHDFGKPDFTDVPDLDKYADLFGYFIFWSQPLNGPLVGKGENFQKLVGETVRQKAFLEAAAGRYPLMASFSFDYANSHWLVLDANAHMDWTDKNLRAWVAEDLARTKATWKFVMFHQPSFTSHSRHRLEQRMRLLCDIFEAAGVDVVFMGHAHWYERMYPLTFKPFPCDLLAEGRGSDEGNRDRARADDIAKGVPLSGEGEYGVHDCYGPTALVDGDFVLDKDFDGVTNTKPKGIVYLVTGAGGAKLQNVDLPIEGLKPFTHKLISDRHSFTVVDINGGTFTLRQLDEDGQEIDAFKITK